MLEYDCREMRATYREVIINIIENNPEVYLLEADLMSACGTIEIMAKYPDRVINVGAAEANMIGIASGMSAYGKIPICHSFSAFLSRRDYDQISISIAYAGLNVKLIGTDPGITAERNGGTHMAFEDVGLMRTLPTMTLFEPCDNVQLKKALPEIVNMYGPVYIRLYRKTPHIIYNEDYKFTFGKADTIREGKDLTIIASGIMVWISMIAANLLEAQGIDARVLNMHTIKPLDEKAVLIAATETGAIVTAENNNYLNGLGSAVAEVLCENDAYVPLKRIGIKDHFGSVGTEAYLQNKYNLTPEDVAKASFEVVKRKAKRFHDHIII